MSGAKGAGSDNGVRWVIGTESAGKVLGAKELEMVIDRKKFGFCVEVKFRGHFVSAQVDLKG